MKIGVSTLLTERSVDAAVLAGRAEELGFDRGFDSWRRTADKAMPKQWRKHLEKVWDAPDAPPQFAYLHLLGPHSPLRPSEAAQAKYQVEAEWFDERLGF